MGGAAKDASPCFEGSESDVAATATLARVTAEPPSAPPLGPGPLTPPGTEPPGREGAPRWGLGAAGTAYGIGFFAQVLLATLFAPIGRVTLAAITAGLVGLWLGLAGVSVWACRARGSGSLARDFGLRVGGVLDVLGGLAVGVACQLVLVPVVYAPLVRAIPDLGHKLDAPARQVAGVAHGAGSVVQLTLLVAVGAPLVEELFFRGLLQRSLRRRLGPVWAVVLSALAFGLAHMELIQLPALVAFGLVLGIMAQRTGRLGPGIFAHMAFNAVTLVVLIHSP